MTLGTAQITKTAALWIVNYRNIGSFLKNEPRAFVSESAAKRWCQDRALRII